MVMRCDESGWHAAALAAGVPVLVMEVSVSGKHALNNGGCHFGVCDGGERAFKWPNMHSMH